MAFPTGWAYQQKLTIQAAQVTATLTDFTVLITRSELHNDIVDPSGSNNAQADGGDIRFSSDAAGTTQLSCEVVVFEHDSTTGAGDAVIQLWVKIPSVSSSVDTDFYIWYKTAGSDTQPAVTDTYGRNAVWSNYVAVFHLEEDPSGTAPQMLDSTGNSHDGTSAGTMTAGDSVAVKVGNGLEFDGTDDKITAGTQTSLNIGDNDLTLQTIVSTTETTDTENAFYSGRGDLGGVDNWYLGKRRGNATGGQANKAVVWLNDGTTSVTHLSNATITDGTARQLAMKLDWTGNTSYLLVEGVVQTATGDLSTLTQANMTNSLDFTIGGSASGLHGLEKLDEVRLSASLISTAHLLSEVNNINSPSTFIIDSTPVAVAGGAFQAAWARAAQQCKILGAR